MASVGQESRRIKRANKIVVLPPLPEGSVWHGAPEAGQPTK